MDTPNRRRIYLMRHAEAAYFREDGSRVDDPRAAPLTAEGREQAAIQGETLAGIAFDRAVCSGLLRTVETATIVLQASAGAAPELEQLPDLAELQGGSRKDAPPTAAELRHIANPWAEGHRPGARFLGGETFGEFSHRVGRAFAQVLQRTDWRTLLLVCHGGTNRAILNHALGLNWGVLDIEQDNACFNILDVDHDEERGLPDRFILRALNVTAYNLTKAGQSLTTMETSARRLAASAAPTEGI